MFSLTTLSLLVLVVPHVSSSVIPSSNLRHLLSRQATGEGVDPSQIPTECQPQCTPFTTIANQCSSGEDITCGCTQQTVTDLVTCLNCLVTLDPATFGQTQSQQVVDGFVNVCVAAGAPVSSGTVSGGEANTTSTSDTTSETSTTSSSTSSTSTTLLTTTTSSSSTKTTASTTTTKPADSSSAPTPSKTGAAAPRELKWGALLVGVATVLASLV